MSSSPTTSTVSFHGHDFTLHGDGTLFWPAKDMLIVSDLHLEKGAALSSGAPLPAYDTIDTLQRLKHQIMRTRPKQLVCLGDSFHTSERAFLLPPDSLAFLHELAEITEFLWITGNHDAHLPERLPGQVHEALTVDTIRLCHEADGLPLTPTISGHYHPKARVKLRARTLSARCFIQHDLDLIMPAFGSYTGGLNICDPALAPFVGKNTIIHLVHDDKTFKIPFQKSIFLRAN